MNTDFIFRNEISRGKVDSRCLHVPSKSSGVTIGAGYDLLHKNIQEVLRDFNSIGLDDDDIDFLITCIGLQGSNAIKHIKNSKLKITTSQEKELFSIIILSYIKRAKKDYKRLNLKTSYSNLDNTVKLLLVDFSYNAGVRKFPKFFKALHDKDEAESFKQYKRYTGGVPLGRRNRETKELLEEYYES